MKSVGKREILELLASGQGAQAPEGLAERIKSEIPESFAIRIARQEASGTETAPSDSGRSKTLLKLAAAIVLSLAAAYLGIQTATSSRDGERSVALRVRPRDTVAPATPESAQAGRTSTVLLPRPLQKGGAAAASNEPGNGPLRGVDNRVKLDAADQTVPVTGEPRLETPSVEGAIEGGIPAGIAGKVIIGSDLYALRTPAGVLRAKGAFELKASVPPPSTGGTREPNDQPYGDMFFRSYGVNPFIDTEDDRFSTFGLDVDTGSYTVARRYLQEGNLPPGEAIRVEELINYFHYGDAPPARGDFALRAEAAPTPFASGPLYRLARFNIRGRVVEAANRKPAVLTFVVDVSGSMEYGNRLELVKEALLLLLEEMRPSDEVALVVFGTDARTLLEHTNRPERVKVILERLAPEGSTNTEEGLKLGYELAARARKDGAINRVILCSDGVANVGRTGPESILSVIERRAKEGIELTTVGFGMGNYNDVLMEQLADKGDGSYAYVDTLEEARRVFVENLTGTLQTIASDAKAQVEFDPQVVARYRLLGYENRDISDEKFRDDTVDAGEIGAGHSVTALYEIKLQPAAGRGDTAATLRLRYLSKETGRIAEIERPLRLSEFSESWEKAPRALRLASLVAEYGEILKGSFWAKQGDMNDVFRRAQVLSAQFAGDPRVAEFVDLAGRAATVKSRQTVSPKDPEGNKKD